MTHADQPGDDASAPVEGESDAETRERARRRRLAEVFGDGPPTQTRDDLPDPGEVDASRDEWLRRQVPPHHG